jgi:alpha-tubulin suppressor-like RCC1 family protein
VAVTVGTKAHFVGHSQRDRLTVPTILDSEGGQELFIKAIAVGGGHCVIVTYDGRCWSWGRAKSGQLGGGSISTAFVGAPREIRAFSCDKNLLKNFCYYMHIFNTW